MFILHFHDLTQLKYTLEEYLKYLKIYLDTNLKIILLDCQNNYETRTNCYSIYFSFRHIWIVQKKLFSNLYPYLNFQTF